MVLCSTITAGRGMLCAGLQLWRRSGGTCALCSIAIEQDRAARAAASLVQSKERLPLVQLVRGGRMFLCPAHRWVAVPLVLIGFAAC